MSAKDLSTNATAERIQTFLPVLAPAILRSAWIETQSTVQSAMWQPLLRFLKGERFDVSI